MTSIVSPTSTMTLVTLVLRYNKSPDKLSNASVVIFKLHKVHKVLNS